MKRIAVCVVVMLLACLAAVGQRHNKKKPYNKVPPRQHLSQNRLLRMRDSLDRVLVVNAGASATLIRAQQFELYTSNTFSGQNYMYDRDGKDANFSGKNLVFSSFVQVMAGVSRKRRLNVGLDANYVVQRYDTKNNASPFSVFESSPTSINTFTYAGPRIKVQPFKKINNLLWQSYVWIPLVGVERQKALGLRKGLWGNSIYYYKFYQQKIGFTAQVNFVLSKDKYDYDFAKTNDIDFLLSFGGNVSYVISKSNVVYVPLLYSRMNDNIKQVMEGADSDEFQYGIGYQKIFSRRFSAQLNYSRTLFAHNYGKWEHMTVGVRYVL